MSQLVLGVEPELRPQRLVTLAGSPVGGRLGKDAKALGVPIKCCLCPPGSPAPELAVYCPSDSGGGLITCRGHARGYTGGL